jgi:hypothetical protein
MAALSIVVWFNRAFQIIGLEGCSSHSGRRTFITRAARLAHRAGVAEIIYLVACFHMIGIILNGYDVSVPGEGCPDEWRTDMMQAVQ